MNTKSIIIKWLAIIYFVSLLPTYLYMIGALMIHIVIFGRILGVLDNFFIMPRIRTLLGLLKRQYMVNKIIKDGKVTQ